MAFRDIDHLLKSLEADAADELSELEAVGPELYSTAQLLRLRGQWEVKNTLFHQVQRFFVRLIALSPLWLLAWLGLRLLGLPYLSLIALAFFPFSFLAFFGGLYFVHRFFKGQGHLDRVGEAIAAELQQRSQAPPAP
ncbi:hypothetical protein [Phaeodactylibacter luteus]|uniref:Uncharacterized protein n=1 Tax=Phaeodactylibacter luteus TaxID=1564516 RepID=A0A5C6RJQ7_9BACT|nr:hypothetical protein [Phaeodactylibacter luteus]TXB62628.1 hypothetical protein FRY97_12865 [Phaeodactylibacter luteus]